MARAIDGDALKQWCEKIIDQACHPATVQIGEVFLDKVRSMPTLTPPNEWVSVEERLPEPTYCVLVYTTDYSIEVDAIGSDGEWISYEVTHWMPLPTPPAKE